MQWGDAGSEGEKVVTNCYKSAPIFTAKSYADDGARIKCPDQAGLPMDFSFWNVPAPGAVPADEGPTLRDLFKGQPTDEYSAGAAIFWESDPAGQIFDIVEGVLRVYRVLADGRRAIVGFIFPGDFLGVSFQNWYPFTAEAVTDVKLRRVSRRRFLGLANESPTMQRQLVALLCCEMSAAQDQMLLLGHNSAEERVASFLLAVRRKSANGNDIELPMSWRDIADYLGLTIETVSRTITSLTRRGLIAAAGRRSLTLRRPGVLRDIAGHGDREHAGSEFASARRAVWPN